MQVIDSDRVAVIASLILSFPPLSSFFLLSLLILTETHDVESHGFNGHVQSLWRWRIVCVSVCGVCVLLRAVCYLLQCPPSITSQNSSCKPSTASLPCVVRESSTSTSLSLPVRVCDVELMPSRDPVSLVILSNEGHWNNCISIFPGLPSPLTLSLPHLFPLSSPPINQKCIKSKVGPIKGRIPPRRTDKAYLINKCFSIREDLCLPPHPCLWYLIILTHTPLPSPLYQTLNMLRWCTYTHRRCVIIWECPCLKGVLQNKQ